MSNDKTGHFLIHVNFLAGMRIYNRRISGYCEYRTLMKQE